MLVVAALGGNAPLERGQPLTPENQRANVRKAAVALAQIVRAGHRLVITHGNGPQIGLPVLKGAAFKPESAFPLDVLNAETIGMIGYIIEQEPEIALDYSNPIVTLVKQIPVDADGRGAGRTRGERPSPAPVDWLTCRCRFLPPVPDLGGPCRLSCISRG